MSMAKGKRRKAMFSPFAFCPSPYLIFATIVTEKRCKTMFFAFRLSPYLIFAAIASAALTTLLAIFSDAASIKRPSKAAAPLP